ncbi:MAG: ORF6N domain-containing protein [Betaproteobacteria bacterium]|nr:ORF6N domain-containing protein [Betaproteobacteria bacterium]
MKSTRLIEPLIIRVRRQRVMLDADLARLYGVTTSALNQAVKRNANRFPEDFAFRLNRVEITNLKSQIGTSSSQTVDSKRKSQGLAQVAAALHRRWAKKAANGLHRSRRINCREHSPQQSSGADEHVCGSRLRAHARASGRQYRHHQAHRRDRQNAVAPR